MVDADPRRLGDAAVTPLETAHLGEWLAVTQADREAAALIADECNPEFEFLPGMYREGKLDSAPLAQAFARHRLAATPTALPSAEDALRPEVAAFALLMERQLRANDHKPGWKSDEPYPLCERIGQELEELRDVVVLGVERHNACAPTFANTALEGAHLRQKARIVERVGEEAADVANMAMMVADVCGALTLQSSRASDEVLGEAGGWTDYLRGIQAAREWLRDQQHKNPPETLWHAAAILADRMDVALLSEAASRVPVDASGVGAFVPSWLIEFLNGEHSWPGHPEVWFGDRHPDHRGAFFWRASLPKAHTAPVADAQAGEGDL